MSSPAVPSRTDVGGVIWRGAIVGVAVGSVLAAMWYPARTCDGPGFSCLGAVVVTIFAMPVIAWLVGWLAAALVRLARPWLVALLGPVAAFTALRIGEVVVDAWPGSLVVSAVLVVLSYVAIALLVRPGANRSLRVLGAAVAIAAFLAPGVIIDRQTERDRVAELKALDVPLLLAELDGYDVRFVSALPGGQVQGEVARLTYELVEQTDDEPPAVITIGVVAQEDPVAACEDLPSMLPPATCEAMGPHRWLVSGPDQNGADTQVLVADQDGARLTATDQVALTPATLAGLQISEVGAAELALLS